MNFESSGAKFFARLLRTLASYFDAASSPLKLEEEEDEEEEEEKNAAKHRLERSKAIVHSARTRTILASQPPFRWGEKDEEEDFLSVVARGKEVLLREVVVVVVVVVGNISNLCLQSVFQFFSRVVGDIMCFN
jgi:ribosomal protein S12 methylthiotransferase accessory factor YcaO